MDPEAVTGIIWLAAGAIFVLAGLVHGALGLLGFPLLSTPLLSVTSETSERGPSHGPGRVAFTRRAVFAL